MKNKISLMLLFFLSFSTSLMAQVLSLSITKNTDMNFGTIAASAVGGAVVLSTSGSRTASGGVMLPSFTGTVSAAQFTVSGQANYTYAITLPVTDFILYESGGGPASIVVTAFTSTPAFTGTLRGTLRDSLSSTLLTGRETVLVGATLKAGASQAAGSYTNTAGFEVIVNYN